MRSAHSLRMTNVWSGGGEVDPEGGTGGSGGEGKSAAHLFDGGLGEGESEAGAFARCAGAVAAVEGFEDVLAFFGRNAGSAIDDGDAHAWAGVSVRDGVGERFGADEDGRILRAVVQGVGDEVRECVGEDGEIAAGESAGAFDADAGAIGGRE